MHYFQLISNVMVPQYEMAEIFIFLLSSPQGCNQNHSGPDFPTPCKCLSPASPNFLCHSPVITISNISNSSQSKGNQQILADDKVTSKFTEFKVKV